MGTLSQPDRRPLQFGVFQLNPLNGELRKHGIRIRLQEQPLKLLLALLETPGEIRTPVGVDPEYLGRGHVRRL